MAYSIKPEKDFVCLIHRKFGELGNFGKWTKELNIVEWGLTNEPKFDIRMWDSTSDHDRSGKGLTLTLDELKALKDILNNIELDGFVMPDKQLLPKFEVV